MDKKLILEKRRHILGDPLMNVLSDTIMNMMDEYAKQQAIAFDEWKIGHKYKASLNMAGELGYEDEIDYWYSPQDVYNQFIEQQQNK